MVSSSVCCSASDPTAVVSVELPDEGMEVLFDFFGCILQTREGKNISSSLKKRSLPTDVVCYCVMW
jgi:hypothetical protein